MPWSRTHTARHLPVTIHWRHWVVLLALVAAFVGSAWSQNEGKQLTVYTARTGYSLPVVDRDGREYVGLGELLEPLGEVSAKVDQKHWKLRFGQTPEVQFPLDKSRVKIGRQEVDLGGPLLVENGRGMVPLQALPAILTLLLPGRSVEFRLVSRRIFLDKAELGFTAELKGSGGGQQLVIGFTAPVNPFVASEPGKTRLVFRREPLRGGKPSETTTFGNKAITSVAYSEANGAAELTVTAGVPLLASFSSDRKTITLAAVAPSAAAQAPAPAAPPTAPSETAAATPAARPAAAAPKFLVMIDAAHGGEDRGAAITDKLAEKDFTMALARRLQKAFEGVGISVRLLRDGDNNLSLDQRAVLANAASPSLVVVLHASGTGSGVRLYTSRLAPEARKSAFVRWETAQAGFVSVSHDMAVAISTELLKHDLAATAMRISVSPMNSIAAPSVAIEIGPSVAEKMDSISSPQYEQAVCTAIATAVAANRSRLPHNEASR